jgi:hypothetical protein
MPRTGFWKDEGGQGIAECVILAPLYVVLTYGVMMFGEMGELKKRSLEAARFAAWKDVGSGEVKDEFFEGVSHEVDISTGEDSEVKVSYKPVEVVRFFAHATYWGGEASLGETLEISAKHSCKRP